MPAFPCAACKSLVDTNDVVCRKCNDRQPFECSKCAVRLSAQEIYEADKLTFKKSLFCHKCGEENSVVQCFQCGTSIIRSVGKKRVGSKGTELVYHEECWKLYEKQDKWSHQILAVGIPVVFVLMGIGLFVMTRNWTTTVEGAAGSAVVVLILGMIARPKG